MTNNFLTGVYVHFPFCKSKCKYCNFISDTNFGDIPAYVEELKKEIRLRSKGEAVDSIYFGGGTPSALPISSLDSVLSEIKNSFIVSHDCEITIECNPESVTDEFVSFCVLSGVTRVSVGVQSACDNELLEAGRIHTFNEAERAVCLLSRGGIKNISCDLMLGLRGQTVESALSSIQSITRLPICHISMYGLKVEEGTPLYRTGYVTDDDNIADMYEKCYLFLKNEGYTRYEVSNFCKNNMSSRHNYKYWLRNQYYGFGVAAHSFLNETRQENTNVMAEYLNGNKVTVSTALSDKERLEETIMLAIRTTNGINLKELENMFNYNLLKEHKNEIDFLIKNDLVALKGDNLCLSENAFYVMNSVILKLID